MRVVHWKKEPFDIFIGRPSEWGNPFSSRENSTAQFKVESSKEAIQQYREWLPTQPHLMAKLPELKGKVLGCWCKPGPCHGDVLLEYVRKLEAQQLLE